MDVAQPEVIPIIEKSNPTKCLRNGVIGNCNLGTSVTLKSTFGCCQRRIAEAAQAS